LDWQVSRIGKLISAKKKQIALLKEQKQAIINKAVTKGLDENVPMKNSGIEWLGQVPEHWEVGKLKKCCIVNASISSKIKEMAKEEKMVFLPMENISVNGKIDCSQKRRYEEVKNGFSSFAKNDVVVAKITPCFENGKGACLDKLETEVGFGTTELITLRANENIFPFYLYLITKISWFRFMGADTMTGSAGQKRVSSDFIANFTLAIPPIDEQQAIVAYLDKVTAKIDLAINNAQRAIALSTEYRTRLISDIVTGKIDVRDVQVPEFEAVEETVDDVPEECEITEEQEYEH
jgi:type I restriction enzyme S subunit